MEPISNVKFIKIVNDRSLRKRVFRIENNKLKYLNVPTDDIDLKIYTTKLHYDKSKNKPGNVKSVLSLFRYIVITLFMFMKQVMVELIDFSKTMFVVPQIKYKKSQTQSMNFQDGGDIKQLIKHTQKSYGVMNSGSIYIQIKTSGKEQMNEKIDITKLTYEETTNLRKAQDFLEGLWAEGYFD